MRPYWTQQRKTIKDIIQRSLYCSLPPALHSPSGSLKSGLYSIEQTQAYNIVVTLTLSRSRQYVVRVAFESSCTMQKYERCTNMPYNLLKEERKEEIKKKKCKNKTIKQETKKKENEKKIVSYFSITKYICKFIITPRIKSVYTSFWKGLDSVFLTSVSLKQA